MDKPEGSQPHLPAQADPRITPQMREAYERTFLIFAGVFVSAVVTCNLIFKKFFSADLPVPFLGEDFSFVASVGLLPYPLTFLVTDLLSEVFGRKRANRVVLAGLAASVFAVLTLWIADAVPATADSPITDSQFHAVFGQAGAAIIASMVAYLAAQYIDIRLFHFWRKLTKGRHLWLRNNASTFASQILDTVLVLSVLAFAGVLPWGSLPALILNSVVFKWLVAAVDTPLFYMGTALCRRHFGPLMDEAHRDP